MSERYQPEDASVKIENGRVLINNVRIPPAEPRVIDEESEEQEVDD